MIRLKLPLRCLWLVRGLKRCRRDMSRIYIGDTRLAKADRADCSESSIRRAKRDFDGRGMPRAIGLINIVRANGGRGGRTRNGHGDVVAAATGYEPHPDLFQLTDEERRQRTGPDNQEAGRRRLYDEWKRVQERNESKGRASP